MKHIIILLFLITISCKSKTKNEIKTESGVDKTVYEMWGNFTKSNSEYKNNEIPESWYFHDNEEDANRLAELTSNGKKKASSGLYYWYEEANADLPKNWNKAYYNRF